MREHTEELLRRLQHLLQTQEQVVLAIDGTSAALKSTLAGYLALKLNGAVIPCDDFFLPMELRSETRYEEPGGNIHYERMKAEVINPLERSKQKDEPGCNVTRISQDSAVGERGCGFNYTRYDCARGALGEVCWVPDVPLRIVEGAYALHPFFGRYYDLSVFLTVDARVQMERIEKRSPHPEMFREKWIPMEQKYFGAFDICSKADIILDTTDWK